MVENEKFPVTFRGSLQYTMLTKISPTVYELLYRKWTNMAFI
jgi:hypothetical protein